MELFDAAVQTDYYEIRATLILNDMFSFMPVATAGRGAPRVNAEVQYVAMVQFRPFYLVFPNDEPRAMFLLQ